ncbi:precorrin-3B synthase [Nonomuraea bangladeshensis]|uniref:precorrin-3B synthase n=1 Tax=Nonomuraea bangladeshensis TaxID=404385 RepID=UPI003C2B0012
MPVGEFPGRTRPDACPGALQVHEAADGPLARVRLPGGAVSAAQLRVLAACAAELGADVIELTSRANVQVRGLRSPDVFARRIAAAGLLPSPAHERVRNIVASPLSGRGPDGLVDVLAMAHALDRALCARPRLAGLPGRFLFALDDGTGDVAGLGADVTYAATRLGADTLDATPAPGADASDATPALGTGVSDVTYAATALGADVSHAAAGRLLLAGTDTGLIAGPDAAIALMIDAAEAFLDELPSGDDRAWRVRELDDGPARIAARLRGGANQPVPDSARLPDDANQPTSAPGHLSGGANPPVPDLARLGGGANPPVPAPARRLPGPDRLPSPRAGRPAAGQIVQRDGRVAVEAVVPLGRLTSGQALALADTGHAVRLTPWRTVVLPDLSPAEADRAGKALDAMGLVTDPDSPWAGVTACTGRPGCAKALADVRADARRWVEGLDRAPATPVHWAGCERRCGLPRGPVVQLIATTNGYEERHP